MSDSDHAKVWELVRTEDGEADAARRAGEVGQRQRGCAGHGVVKATNGGGWQGLGQRVCGLVGGRDVDEADGAGVDHLVAKAVVAGVDVGARCSACGVPDGSVTGTIT